MRYSVDGEWLGGTAWLPNGNVDYQIGANGSARNRGPWLFGESDHARSVSDIRELVLESGSPTPINLESWGAPDLLAQRCMLGLVDLRGATLPRARFDFSRLDYVFLEKADLAGAAFVQAQVVRCNLSGANLRGSLWDGAVIEDSLFDEADLTGARFVGASLRNLDLRNTSGLRREQLEDADLDDSVLLPEGLRLELSPQDGGDQ